MGGSISIDLKVAFGKIQRPFLNFEVWLILTFWNNFKCMESCWKVQKTLSSFTHLSVFCHIDPKWDIGDAGRASFCHIVVLLTYRSTFREIGGPSSPFSLQGPWVPFCLKKGGVAPGLTPLVSVVFSSWPYESSLFCELTGAFKYIVLKIFSQVFLTERRDLISLCSHGEGMEAMRSAEDGC